MFSEELFLTNETGRRLYHQYAEDLPIIDYHCHLLPQEIYENREFEDLGEMWLAHDHYKWRAMRTFGIDEKYITGDSSFYEKYLAFAGILPQLIGNPIYIWCALELKRYFDIAEPLGPDNAEEIYQRTKQLIAQRHMTPRWCMERSRVEVVSTTEDPIDDLRYHIAMKDDPAFSTRIISAFRPDQALGVEKSGFAAYISQLAQAAEMEIHCFDDMVEALERRLKFFQSIGTMISDTALDEIEWAEATPEQVNEIFRKGMDGEPLTELEVNQYRTAFVLRTAEMYHRNGFVMQLHVGAYRGANTEGERRVGVACGFDCTGENVSVYTIGNILDYLEKRHILPKTILYPLNAAQIETYAILAAGFCGDGVKGKVQLGAPWWFNDQSFGIDRQFQAVANLYPVSLSVGMLTDSRSFLSYPRHELYRRVLCNYLGTLVERGEYFSGEAALKTVVQNVCYYNAREYFGL